MLIAPLLFGAMACSTLRMAPDAESVHAMLAERGAAGLARQGVGTTLEIPPSVNLADGLDRDEAVEIALWNNADFHEALSTLGIVRSDLQQAGLLRNPDFSLLFPTGPKQLEFAVGWAIDSVWQRPKRIRLARLAADRVASGLVATGLATIRDVRVAYADCLLADQRVLFEGRAEELQRELADMLLAAFRAGERSDLELRDARAAVASAHVRHSLAVNEREIAYSKLARLLGLNSDIASTPLSPAPASSRDALRLPGAATEGSVLDADALVGVAFIARPEFRSAEIAVAEAIAELGLQKVQIIRLRVVLDANADGSEGFEMGPGLSAELPLFDHNQAGVARARSDLERASWAYVRVRRSIREQVEVAVSDHAHALDAWIQFRDIVLPEIDWRLSRAALQHDEGDLSRQVLLETERDALALRYQVALARADVDRTKARLEYSVGRYSE